MDKGRGATGVVAVILAGLLFKGVVTGPVSPDTKKETLSSQTATMMGEGPWQASCKYWSSILRREQTEHHDSKDVTFDIQGSQIAPAMDKEQGSSDATTPCGSGSDSWGVPGDSDHPSFKPEISAIIATVPDPVHSHLALDFDRTVDSLLLAASDNHYLGSYYWLPWSAQTTLLSDSANASSDAERLDKRSEIREQQPGLVILRYAPNADWENDKKGAESLSRAAYWRVVYLFLVAETPTLGINGIQLQNAFRYENMLQTHGARLSISPVHSGPQGSHNDKLSIIGPIYSGSAASLRAGIEAAKAKMVIGPNELEIAGATSTRIAAYELDPTGKHVYRSFGENSDYEETRLLTALSEAGFDLSRVAILSEEGTVFGSSTKAGAKLTDKGTILHLLFPRELSLLRNAQNPQSPKSEGSAPSPYLNLSLKEHAADDGEPRFSAQSPASIEAQLMAIAHQLQRVRAQFILMSASNILDDIYLSQFLHRACPDARIVILEGADLLMARDVDDEPFIGSIGITPFLLTSLNFGSQSHWLYPGSTSESIYNAASYIFWDRTNGGWPHLAGYRRYPIIDRSEGEEVKAPSPEKKGAPINNTEWLQIPLFATAIGTDGYYPLAVLSWCGSDFDAILPSIRLKPPKDPPTEICSESASAKIDRSGKENDQLVSQFIPESINSNSGISPSLLWVIIAATVIFACVAHCLFLLGAQYLSPLTRDLAIDDNDLPHRRAVLLNIGMAVLVSFAFVTACPLLRLSLVFHVTPVSYFLAIALVFAAAAVCLTTLKKTGPYFYCKTESESLEYLFFNVIALMALIMTVAIWTSICFSDAPTGMKNYAGVYFSYRCLHPMSGVCPLVPVILLLTAWYCWSICQTARLRFSEGQRPRIARRIVDNPGPYPPQISPYDLFVPDETLDACSRPVDCCLYKNMTSLLITREVVRRFVNNRIFRLAKSGKMQPSLPSQSLIKSRINWGMAIFYVVLFALCLFALHIQSLDRFVFAPLFHLFGSRRNIYGPTLYEVLVIALFFPLIMVSLSGCLRTVLIWGSLSRGLLEPLERMPIRFAFTRIKIGSWMALLRQSGLNIRWRDVSRSIEAIRQFLNHPDLTAKPELLELKRRLSLIYEDLNSAVQTLLPLLGPPPHDAISIRLAQPPGWDHPKGYGFDVLRLIYTIEVRCAKFSQVVLRDLLIPHWERNRVGLVEDCNDSSGGEESELDNKPKGKKNAEHKQPSLVDLAEELMVIRYIALIRQVLVNMRYLMFFVSVAFVLSLIAWNSYPFQPHALIDWCFTILLTIITIGFIAVFAQVHRNGILSRITNSAPNVLGWDFYIRLITFGAIPVLTWLAYQFPQIGGSLYRIFQPGLQVVK